MKTKILLFLALLTFNLWVFASSWNVDNSWNQTKEATIAWVDASKLNIVKIKLDTEVQTKDDLNLTSDLKIYKSLEIKNFWVDLNDSKKLNVELSNPLQKNTTYSFLSIYDIDWNMDFSVWDELNWVEIEASWDAKNISKVKIESPRKLTFFFKNDLTPSEDMEIKILKEIKIDKILLDSENNKQVNVILKDNLEENKKYILMMFELNSNKEKITILNNVYDFETKSDLKKEDTSKVLDKKVVDKVALNAAETPDTGPETNVLIFLTFIISTIVYFRRKKS